MDIGGRPLRIGLADSDPFLDGKTTVRGERLSFCMGAFLVLPNLGREAALEIVRTIHNLASLPECIQADEGSGLTALLLVSLIHEIAHWI